MSFELSAYFRKQRLEKGLSLGQVAMQCGYKNISKGANKLSLFETEGKIEPRLLKCLTEALQIDPQTVAELIKRDRATYIRIWNEWADQPVAPKIITRVMPAVFVHRKIPTELQTREELEDYAAKLVDECRFKLWLVLSRREAVYFDQSSANRVALQAKPGSLSITPTMKIGGVSCMFLFSNDTEKMFLKPDESQPIAPVFE